MLAIKIPQSKNRQLILKNFREKV